MNGLLVSLFEYKAWANASLHTALERFDAQKNPDRFEAMLSVLDHVNVVDQIFQSHLIGSAGHFTAAKSVRTPTLSALRAAVTSTDNWYLQFAADIGIDRLQERIGFAFTDGDSGAMTREEMLMHVITHGGYHRGAVGQMLEDAGVDSPPDSLTKFLHRRDPARRLQLAEHRTR